MKFSYGAWQIPPGVKPTLVQRVYRTELGPDSLHVAGLDRQGTGWDRFEGSVIQLDVTSPMPNVIRVQARHHVGSQVGVRRFDLDYSLRAENVKVQQCENCVQLSSGDLTLRLNKSDFHLSFQAAGRAITRGRHGHLGYMKTDGEPRLMQRLSLGVGETIYGLGERFGPFVKNGQSVTIWNEDGGTISDLAYKNVPFYLSSAGYGLLINSPAKVELEIATERVSQIQFSVPGEELDYYFFYGPDPKAVLDQYTRLSGRPARLPAWSYGLWLSTSFTTQYNEKTVMEFVDGMASRGIPLSVFHFDCFWMKERHWCNFEWDQDAFPDPRGMLARLKAKGLKTCVWINSYIAQLSPLFAEGRAQGYFIKRTDGSVFQIDQWQPGMAIVDFTNPAAVKWYQGKLRALLEMGVDAFKTDFGERIPTDVVYHDGSDPQLMHNYYPYLYNKAVFELLEDYHGKGNAILFARSSTTGCQKFPIHWGGDCEATWESMAEDLRGGLSFCLSGNAFWSHDIGGFAGKANPALYKRWIAFGLLSSHSRLHGSESYRVPWLFDEESVDVMRHFVKLKNSLFPYIAAAGEEAHERGTPVMRAMVLEFPQDLNCRHLDRQYLLGPSLLVAPVMREDDVVEFYLPAGTWTHVETGESIAGPRWVIQQQDFMQVPAYVREHTLLPISSNVLAPEWKSGIPTTLRAYELADNVEAACTLLESDGDRSVSIACVREGSTYTFTCTRKVAGLSVNVPTRRIERASHGRVVESRLGDVVEWSDTTLPLTIRIKDAR